MSHDHVRAIPCQKALDLAEDTFFGVLEAFDNTVLFALWLPIFIGIWIAVAFGLGMVCRRT